MKDRVFLLNLKRELNDDQIFKGSFQTRLEWIRMNRIPKDDAKYFLGLTLNSLFDDNHFVNSYYYVYKNDTVYSPDGVPSPWYSLTKALYIIEEYERLNLSEYKSGEVIPEEDEYIKAMIEAGDLAAKLQPHGNPSRPINSDFSLWITHK